MSSTDIDIQAEQGLREFSIDDYRALADSQELGEIPVASLYVVTYYLIISIDPASLDEEGTEALRELVRASNQLRDLQEQEKALRNQGVPVDAPERQELEHTARSIYREFIETLASQL